MPRRKPPAPDLFAPDAEREARQRLEAAGWRAVVGRDGRTPTGFWAKAGRVKSQREALAEIAEGK